MLAALSVPDTNTRNSQYMKDFLDALNKGNTRRLRLTLSYGRHDQAVGLYVRYPPELQSIIEHDLPSFYDGCALTRLADDALQPATGLRQWSLRLHLRPDVFPLPEQRQFEEHLERHFVDPLTGILSRLGDRRFFSRIDLVLRPASRRRHRYAQRIRDSLERFPFAMHRTLAHSFARTLTSPHAVVRLPASLVRFLLCPRPRVTDDTLGHDKVRGHFLFEAELRLIVAAPKEHRAEAKQQLRALAGAFAPLSRGAHLAFDSSSIRSGSRLKRHYPWLASSHDVSCLWHPITKMVNASMLTVTESRTLEPSPELARHEQKSGDLLIGKSTFRNEGHPALISQQDRLRHGLIIGQTGTGRRR